jgi:hypothetical protein
MGKLRSDVILENNHRKNYIYLEDAPTTTEVSFVNHFLDELIFGRTEELDNHPRSTFLLMRAFQPIIFGLTATVILSAFFIVMDQIIFYFFSSFIEIKEAGRLFINFVFLILTLFLLQYWIRSLVKIDREFKPKKTTFYAKFVYVIIFCLFLAVSVRHDGPTIVRDIASTGEMYAKNHLYIYTSCAAILASGLVNFFHLRSAWSKRWELCFENFCKVKRKKSSKLDRALFMESLIDLVMWGHPVFSEFFYETFISYFTDKDVRTEFKELYRIIQNQEDERVLRLPKDKVRKVILFISNRS